MAMRCNVCALASTNEEWSDELEDLFAQGMKPRDAWDIFTGNHPEVKATAKDFIAHKRHLDEDDESKPALVYIKDGQVFDAKTNELIPKYTPREALDIVVSLGVRQILKNGGAKIGVRNLVEALKILSDMALDDETQRALQMAWTDSLRGKARLVEQAPKELPFPATDAYLAQQQKDKDTILRQLYPDAEVSTKADEQP